MAFQRTNELLVLAFSAGLAVSGCRDSGTVEHKSETEGLTRVAFDRSTVETLEGTIADVEVYQRIGRSNSGMRVLLRCDDELYYVYLGPVGYLSEMGIVLARGQQIEVRGSVRDGNGHRVVVAEAITVGETTVALRDEDGRPKWRAWRRPQV